MRQPVQFRRERARAARQRHHPLRRDRPAPGAARHGRRLRAGRRGHVAAVAAPRRRRLGGDPREPAGALRRGAAVDWAGFDRGLPRRRVALPTYPFQRKRHWAEGLDDAPRRRPTLAHLLAQCRRGVAAPVGLQSDRPRPGAVTTRKWASLARLTTAQCRPRCAPAGLFAQRRRTAHRGDGRAARLGAGEVYRHLLRRWLERLVDAACCVPTATAFVADAPLPEPALDALLVRGANGCSPTTGAARLRAPLRRRCCRPCCAAREPARDAVSRRGVRAGRGLYHRSSTMRYINDLAAERLQAFAAARPRGAAARAGDRRRDRRDHRGPAAVSAGRPPALPLHRCLAVLLRPCARGVRRHGRRRVRRVRPRPAARRRKASTRVSFDLVIASNAVHASRDLRAALQRLRALLAPGGVLLLVESTAHLAWFDMTTGLDRGVAALRRRSAHRQSRCCPPRPGCARCVTPASTTSTPGRRPSSPARGARPARHRRARWRRGAPRPPSPPWPRRGGRRRARTAGVGRRQCRRRVAAARARRRARRPPRAAARVGARCRDAGAEARSDRAARSRTTG